MLDLNNFVDFRLQILSYEIFYFSFCFVLKTKLSTRTIGNDGV
jgi:hypothetical protein